jgi:mRNA interferase YafQ
MRQPHATNQFKRDVRRMKRRHKAMHKLKSVIDTLSQDIPLEPRFKDHSLIGKYKGRRECHIQPDWLLIYQLEGDHHITLERTGTHSDLFG